MKKLSFIILAILAVLVLFACPTAAPEDDGGGTGPLVVFSDDFSTLMGAPGTFQSTGVTPALAVETTAANVKTGAKSYKFDLSTLNAANEWGGFYIPFATVPHNLSAYNALTLQIKAADATKVLEQIKIETDGGFTYQYYMDATGVASPAKIKLADTNFHKLTIPLLGSNTALVKGKQIAVTGNKAAGDSGVFYFDDIQFESLAVTSLPTPSKIEFNFANRILFVAGTSTSTVPTAFFPHIEAIYYFDKTGSTTYKTRVIGPVAKETGIGLASSATGTATNPVISDNNVVSVTGVAAGAANIFYQLGGSSGPTMTTGPLAVRVLAGDTDATKYYLLKAGGSSDFNGVWNVSNYGLNTTTSVYNATDNKFTLVSSAAGASTSFMMSSPMDLTGKTIKIKAGAGANGDDIAVYLFDSLNNNSAQVQVNGATGLTTTATAQYTVTLAKLQAAATAADDILQVNGHYWDAGASRMATGTAIDITKVQGIGILVVANGKTIHITELVIE